jgi:hypothetical protein
MRSSSWIAPDPLPSLSPLRRCLHPAPARDHDTARSRQSDTAARRAPHPYLRCALPYAHTPSHPDPVAPNAVRPGPDGAPLPPPASSDGCGCVWAWRRYRGGAAGIRTPDLRRAKAALSQLSYDPRRAGSPRFVGAPGLEPGTSVLSGPRSHHLSYAPHRGAGRPRVVVSAPKTE